jgi:hypothetical protein
MLLVVLSREMFLLLLPGLGFIGAEDETAVSKRVVSLLVEVFSLLVPKEGFLLLVLVVFLVVVVMAVQVQVEQLKLKSM